MADRSRLSRPDDVEDLRVDGRLAAGNLQEVRFAFARHQPVEHALNLGERPMIGLRRAGIGEADGAGKVARLVHVDEGEARMLLVVGTEAAVVGATEFGARLEDLRPVAGLDVIATELEVGGVGRDQGLLDAVSVATFQVEDVVAFDDDLRRH